jgi:hypothetical protein
MSTIADIEAIRKVRPLSPQERGKLGALRRKENAKARAAAKEPAPARQDRVQVGRKLIERGRPAVSILSPNGVRATVTPVGRPRNGQFYRLAFALYIGDKRVSEFVHRNWQDANDAHDRMVEALKSLVGAE